ncbi:hypothetical protein HAX54_043613, partial [Datura stramonium]|nr:hypothetical protein [Datura stramonium]
SQVHSCLGLSTRQSGLGEGGVKGGLKSHIGWEWTDGLFIWTWAILPHELAFGVELGPGIDVCFTVDPQGSPRKRGVRKFHLDFDHKKKFELDIARAIRAQFAEKREYFDDQFLGNGYHKLTAAVAASAPPEAFRTGDFPQYFALLP